MDKISKYYQDNKDKKILIWGLGLQGGGISAVKFFSKFTKNIKITDLKTAKQLKPSLNLIKNLNLTYTLGEHKKEDFLWADIIVINQDIFNKASDSPLFNLIKENDKKTETQTGLFFKLCACPIIGITGTRGKTTTTVAAYKLLKNHGFRVMFGGNIPHSHNIDKIEETTKKDYAILELSNFMLHGLHWQQQSPHIAIITSISPDHLASYETMSDYIYDKTAVCRYQTKQDFLIIKKDIDYEKNFTKHSQAKIIEFNKFSLPVDWQIQLKGDHNRENLGAICELAHILNIDDAMTQKTLTNFKGVEYRLQIVANQNGVTFINDTTASSPTAAQIALKSFPAEKIIWLAGGNTKNLPLDTLVETAKNQVKYFICLKGDATEGLIKMLKAKIKDWDQKYLGTFTDFKQAIQIAVDRAEKGDHVLLSPGFTSFAMFNNEFDRGDQFNWYLKEILAQKE
jgi:UDP-N-acetylmuramoylalanine--D-glutamate ligase